MKIMVSYASAGAGHFKAAQAIYNYIKERCPEIDIRLVDAIEKASLLFRLNYYFGYSFLVSNASFLWWLGYWITDFKPWLAFTRPITSLINRLNTKGFSRLLIQENPDVIISTHFLPSELASNLKKVGKIKSRIVTIITDFCVHSFWVSQEADTYVVASEFTKELLVSKGIAEASIKVLGIPVDAKFLSPGSKSKLCEKFAIDENKFTILIMTGSFGFGPLEQIVNALYREVQVLVVCAANKKLYVRLKERGLPNVRVFGFIDFPQELMAVSDIIITKPGGLTISEVISTELVPVFISAIPGQEAGNIEALRKYSVGLCARSVEDIKNTVLDFNAHQDKLEMMKENIRKLKKPNCLREICNAVCQGSAGATC